MEHNNDSQLSQQLGSQAEEFLEVWFQVRQQVQGLNFNRAHQHGVSTTQFMVLGFIGEATAEEPCTISWLANRLSIDPATAVRTVDSLEKRGLVARRRDKKDRRVVFVEFTEEGRQTQASLHQNFKSRLISIFSAMTQEGRVALLKGLGEFVTVGQLQESSTDSTSKPETEN